MRVEEARYIGQALAGIPADRLTPVLELGASHLEFRTTDKPHIAEYVHAPLIRRGVQIVTTDLKQGPGIDISGDIYSASIQERLQTLQPGCVLCCNLLEHLADPASFTAACATLVPAEALLIVSVPRSYPFHADPIDNGYRPTPAEIAALFPGFEVVDSAVVASTTYWRDLQAMGHPYLRLARVLSRLPQIWHGRRWRARTSRLLWLFRPYKVSIAVLRNLNGADGRHAPPSPRPLE